MWIAIEGVISLVEQQKQSYDSAGKLNMVIERNENACQRIIQNQIAGLEGMTRRGWKDIEKASLKKTLSRRIGTNNQC